MSYELMYGPKAVKDFVNDYLRKELPSRLVDYRNGWNLDDESLPEPLEYLTYEPVALDTWPTIITVVISTNSLERTDYTPLADPLYRVTYSMRTYIWVKDDEASLAADKRDNLTTVVRSVLLDNQCLGAADTTGRKEVLIEEGSVREEFSDLTLLKGDRVMCGAYIAYELNLSEIIGTESLGEYTESDISVTNVSHTTYLIND